MVTLDEVAEMALRFPQTVEDERHGNRAWAVAGKAFAWDRRFSKADIKRYGDTTPPDGAIVALRVADLHEKSSILAAEHGGVFTIPHFDGYAAVLVQLKAVHKRTFRGLLTDAWLACAPDALAQEWVSR